MGRDALAARIVDAAVAEAEQVGWENVRLRLVAQRLNLSLNDVLERFRDLDAVADAWFQRGWEAMLAVPFDAAAQASDRLERYLLAWFDALAPHRRITGQMLQTKLYPSHPHHWVPTIFNLCARSTGCATPRGSMLAGCGGKPRRSASPPCSWRHWQYGWGMTPRDSGGRGSSCTGG